MAIIKQDFGSISGSSFSKTIENLDPTTKSSTVLTWDLSSVTGANNFELFQNFFPYLVYAYYTGNGGAIDLTYTWSWDASTKILTMTLGGATGYIYFNSNGNFKLDVYTS